MSSEVSGGTADNNDENAGLPKGMGNAFAFQACNTMSYSVVLGTPMVLWFQNAGATATLLGLVVALTPLFTILQIPAAKYIDIIGCRKLVLNGWATRSCFILGMVAVGFLPGSVDLAWRLGLMFLCVAAFNAVRGIATCGFLPWMTQLVPERVRGRYVSLDQMASALAMLVSMLLMVGFLELYPSRYNFPVMFLWSYIMAILSLLFLRKIPDVSIHVNRQSGGTVPWMAILKYRPFTRLLSFNIFMATGFAASSAFWVRLLKEHYEAGNGVILGIIVIWSATLAVTLALWGRVSDRVGSKPLMALALVLFTIHFAAWAGLAGRVLPFNWWILSVIQISAGIAAGIFNAAAARLVMGTMPVQGRAHFFALHSVIVSLVMGILPAVYGAGIDALSGWKHSSGVWEWNAFSVMYCCLIAIAVAGQWFCHRIPEPRAMNTEAFFRELLVETPLRALTRFFIRRPTG